MTKAELIGNISREAKMSKATAARALTAFTGSVTRTLKKGSKLTLPGIGTFSLTKRKARIGRNPQTGKEIRIPAAKVAKFKAGNVLRGAVR